MAHRSATTLLALTALLAAHGVRAAAQSTAPQSAPLPGYTPAGADGERRVEADAIRRPAPSSAEAHSRVLSREPHVSGTPAQARTRDYVVQQMKQWGLETEVRAYDVWMPHPTAVHVWRVAPDTLELPLEEGPVAGDSTSRMPQYPTVNGYSGTGDVSGEVVYVGYGLVEDYAVLDSLGVSVRGKVAIAKYGRSFRGIKAREAEKHGAVALLIYSDPQDDGFVRGDVYPQGPMRPPQGVQRGSVMNTDGDPSTPGYGSVKGVRRVPMAEFQVPRIPVVPIGYRNATELLRDLRGTSIPQSWQGGLPFRYHVGPGPVRARVAVATDSATAAYKTIWNTLTTVRGSEFPDEIVMMGGHRDAWDAGAADNVSGTVSVLEAARAVAEGLKAGVHPRRTIVFATWDAEEWGLIGSTEYIEDDSLRLQRGAVAYLNQDVSAQGVMFGAGGSPSLRPTLRDVARHVDDPNGRGTVYDQWRRMSNVTIDSMEPAMGDPGGGSDFAGFYNHLGIPIAEWGFGGPGGVYHSAYDSFNWMSKFGDPGFRYHATAARIGAAMVLRLANADVVPYDYVEYARTMRGYLPALDRAAQLRKLDAPTAPIAVAIDSFERAARTFAATRDRRLAASAPPRATIERTNAALRRVERSLIRNEGLRTRPWFRNLIYAADENNGYSNVVLPSVSEAIRAGDADLVRREAADLAARFRDATRALVDAEAALR